MAMRVHGVIVAVHARAVGALGNTVRRLRCFGLQRRHFAIHHIDKEPA
jgi:hypothetical protein